MFNKYGKILKKKIILLSIIISLILLTKPSFVNLENISIINNYDSQINLIIKGSGNQNILNNSFQYVPSEVIINGYKNNSCKKICYFTDDLNNILLIIYFIILINFKIIFILISSLLLNHKKILYFLCFI